MQEYACNMRKVDGSEHNKAFQELSMKENANPNSVLFNSLKTKRTKNVKRRTLKEIAEKQLYEKMQKGWDESTPEVCYKSFILLLKTNWFGGVMKRFTAKETFS